MIPKQPLQVLINVLMLLVAGWLTKLGIDEESAGALAGAVGAILVAVVVALLQRRKLLETPPPDQGSDAGKNFPPLGALLLPVLLCLSLVAGCANVDKASTAADQARYEAIEPLVSEHVQRHPDQSQTWADFLAAWRMSLDARQQ